jgi:hypothetical protein
MKIPAAAAVLLLALTLAGCSSADAKPAAPATMASDDLRNQSLYEITQKLDAMNVDYTFTVMGSPGMQIGPVTEKTAWRPVAFTGTEVARRGGKVEILIAPKEFPPNPPSTPTPTPTPTAEPTRTITYVVTADGPILNTTFGNRLYRGSLSTEQANDVRSPFIKEYTFTMSQLQDSFFSVSAQAGQGTTTISCQINVDEVKGPVKTSTGPYAIVMCTN